MVPGTPRSNRFTTGLKHAVLSLGPMTKEMVIVLFHVTEKKKTHITNSEVLQEKCSNYVRGSIRFSNYGYRKVPGFVFLIAAKTRHSERTVNRRIYPSKHSSCGTETKGEEPQ